jgi:hypothetical protein
MKRFSPASRTGLPAATYTATATQLTIFDRDGVVTTWTKQ